MSKKDKHAHRETHRKIKHVLWWALSLGVLGGILYLAVTAPRVNAGELESATGLHYHAHLFIRANGVDIPVENNIGIGPVHNGVHTHEEGDGTIHMEFEGKVKKDDIRLGKVFQVWGKDFSATSLMGNKVEGGHTLVMKVNGVVSTEYEHYLMQDKDKIELDYQ
jgi:hypothetical protein